ncbi:MAG TPA: FAD-dependent oxidoreductase [Oligoflexia bacterium]|nr:FAD-dependent oxidoreductase [Oligoflexia bacterium]HMR24504.1 FAD-dependent oxidoreductase [Oligoflexia bacterium]
MTDLSSASKPSQQKTIAIFGAGMAGLSAASELAKKGYHVDVYEQNPQIAGLAATFKDDDGFMYDNGPRFIFSSLAKKIGILDQCFKVKYYEHLYVKERFYEFPFGFVKNPLYCLSAGSAMVLRNFKPSAKNLQQYLYQYYGKYFSKSVLQPLIEKWAGMPAQNMSLDFASRLLPTNIKYILHQIMRKVRKGITKDYFREDRYIVYPKQTNALIFETLANTPGVHVHLNHKLEHLEIDNKKITSATVNGKKITADAYLSTIPINHLAHQLKKNGIDSAWDKLHYRGIVILFIKLRQKQVLQGLWSWFPEDKYAFYRVSEFKNALAHMAPKDKTLIAVEFACQEEDQLFNMNADQLLDQCFNDLNKIYGLDREKIIGLSLNRSPQAYPVLSQKNKEIFSYIDHVTPVNNLFIAGRTGTFQYRMLERTHESGLEAAKYLENFLEEKNIHTLKNSKQSYDQYGRPNIIPE